MEKILEEPLQSPLCRKIGNVFFSIGSGNIQGRIGIQLSSTRDRYFDLLTPWDMDSDPASTVLDVPEVLAQFI